MEIINNGITSVDFLIHLIETKKFKLHRRIKKISNHKGEWTIFMDDRIKLDDLFFLINIFNEYLDYDNLNLSIDDTLYEWIAGGNTDKYQLAQLLQDGVV